MKKINNTFIPSDYTRRFTMDWDWNSDTGSWDATVTNWVWGNNWIWYKIEGLQWGGSTTFTYSSVTFTNSYIFKNWVFTKNSSEVTSTALNWVNWSNYDLLTFFNRTLTDIEEVSLKQEGLRQLWPTETKSTIPVSWLVASYDYDDITLDTSGNWNNGTATGVSTQKVGQQNVWVYNGSSSYMNMNISNFSTYADISFYFSFNTMSTATTQVIVWNDLWLRVVVASWSLHIQSRSSWAVWQEMSSPISANTNYNWTVTFKQNWTCILYLNNVNVVSMSVTDRENADIYGVFIWVDNRASKTLYFNWIIGLVRFYNRVLTQAEIDTLNHEAKTKLSFPNYSLRSLEVGKVLEISKAQIGWSYIDQTGNGNNWTPTNVTDSTVGLNNVMSFNWASSWIDATITTWANFSISLSFKATNISLTARLFARWTFWNDLSIQVFQSKIRWLIWQDWSWLVIWTQSATLISWKTYRYILSYDWANLKQYLDWVLITNDATTATIWTWAILSSFWYDTNENKEYFGWQIGLPRIYNRVLTQAEIASLHHEGLTKLSFPNYSLRNLEVGKVLEISNPQSGWSYIDQTGNGNNWTASNVTDSTVGLNNVMGFNSTSSKITVSDTFNINTISFNLRTTDNDNNRMLFSTNNSWQSNYIWQIHTSWFLYSNLWGWSILLPAPTWELNKNYYVTLTTDWAKMSIYIDGVFFASQPTTFSMFYGNIWTGENWYYTWYYFWWELNSINTYQRALSETEIQQDFYSNKIV